MCKVVILAGGMGHRLGIEEDRVPKPLTKIGEIPIIEHIMNIYSSYQYDEFILCLGYKGHLIKEYFKNYYMYNYDMKINVYQNKDEYYSPKSFEIKDWVVHCIDTGLNTATGSRLKRIKHFVNDRICLTYGDGLTNVPIDKLLKFHKSHGKLVTITTVQPKGVFGIIEIANDNQIINFQEKPKHEDTFINAGFMVVEKEALDYIEDNDNEWWESDTLPKLVKDGQVMAYKHNGEFKAMDSPKDKIELEEIWRSGKAFWVKE